VVGGDPNPEVPGATSAKLGRVKTLVVLDLLSSPLTNKAQFVLAGGSFAERDGSFMNHAGLVQGITRAIQGPLEARPDGRILSELAGRGAMFNGAKLRAEIAKVIPAFGSLGEGRLGQYGIVAQSADQLQPV
jgi:NADH-quinone oxidoreductase subunit G